MNGKRAEADGHWIVAQTTRPVSARYALISGDVIAHQFSWAMTAQEMGVADLSQSR
jgi:hypothetical protein